MHFGFWLIIFVSLAGISFGLYLMFSILKGGENLKLKKDNKSTWPFVLPTIATKPLLFLVGSVWAATWSMVLINVILFEL